MVSDTEEYLSYLRKRQRERIVGNGAVCTGCGESDPTVLVKHHVALKRNDPNLVATRCQNCHYRSHETLRDFRVSDRAPKDRHVLEQLAVWLDGIAAFLFDLAVAFLLMAKRLAALVETLDARLPTWREATS